MKERFLQIEESPYHAQPQENSVQEATPGRNHPNRLESSAAKGNKV